MTRDMQDYQKDVGLQPISAAIANIVGPLGPFTCQCSQYQPSLQVIGHLLSSELPSLARESITTIPQDLLNIPTSQPHLGAPGFHSYPPEIGFLLLLSQTLHHGNIISKIHTAHFFRK